MRTMSRPFRLALGAMALALGLTAGALAATRLEVQAKDTLTVMGSAPTAAWLGVSMYPPGATSPKQGKHMIRRVEKGDFNAFFAIASEYRRGSYEVALWKTQVPLAQCRIDHCQWCARNGFHMDGLILYKRGTLSAR